MIDPAVAKKCRAAIRKGLNILARKTTQNFKAKRHGFTERRIKWTTRKGKEREKILRVATVKADRKDKNVQMVHIMSDFRVKFFEMGTRERRTKGRKIVGKIYIGRRKWLARTGKGRDTGRIKPEWNFRKAQWQTEGKVNGTINKEMDKIFRNI